MQTTNPRILYLDQNAEESYAMSGLLKLANYRTVTTNFASDALQFARCDVFDLYLLRFPVDSGLYLCQKLHEIAPQTPIVFMSDATGDVDAGERAPSTEHDKRNNNAEGILDAVRRALSNRKNASAALSS